MEVHSGTKVGVAGGGEFEIDEIEKQKCPIPNFMIFAKFKKQFFQ